MTDELTAARERLEKIAWPVKDSADPRMSDATIADLRLILAALVAAPPREPMPWEVEAMANALRKAGDQFAFYADEHAKKGTPEADAKARTNHGWALQCARHASLATSARPPVQKEG